MNKKEYNALVQDCTHSECWDCVSFHTMRCKRLRKLGLSVSDLRFYSQLTDKEKEIVKKAQ